MFGAMMIHEVEPGTVIEHDGEERTVTDTEAVIKGDSVYVTPKQYAALKAHPGVTTKDSQ